MLEPLTASHPPRPPLWLQVRHPGGYLASSFLLGQQQLPTPKTVRNAQRNLAFQGCVYPPPSDSRCHLQQLPVGAGSVVYNTSYSALFK